MNRENTDNSSRHTDGDDTHPGAVALKDIEQVLSQWGELPDKVRRSASVFRFVSSRLDPRSRTLDVPDEVATRFESVCLWVRKILPQLAPEVQEQAKKLIEDTNAEHTILAIHTLGDEHRRRLRFKQSASIAAALANMFGMFKIGIDDSTAAMLREEQLQSTKIALGRLAAMLDYAANDLNEIEDLDDLYFRKHYDPQRVDRIRVITLLQTLKSQLEALPENDVRNRLIANVEELTREVQRPRPRWRSFLGKAIILLAVVADIKTMHPELGSDILRTIDVVIQVVVTGCQVTPNQLPADTRDEGPKHWAIEPKRIEFKKESVGDNEDNSG